MPDSPKVFISFQHNKYDRFAVRALARLLGYSHRVAGVIAEGRLVKGESMWGQIYDH